MPSSTPASATSSALRGPEAARLAALVGVLLLSACGEGPATAPPAPVPLAPGLDSPAEYAFGSAVGAADAAARARAIDRFESEFGPLEAGLHRWPADRPVRALQDWYATRLAAEGWVPLTRDERLMPGAWLFAWQRDGQLFALIGQSRAEPGDSHLPITILTNRPD